jgi:hypothetical protein
VQQELVELSFVSENLAFHASLNCVNAIMEEGRIEITSIDEFIGGVHHL